MARVKISPKPSTFEMSTEEELIEIKEQAEANKAVSDEAANNVLAQWKAIRDEADSKVPAQERPDRNDALDKLLAEVRAFTEKTASEEPAHFGPNESAKKLFRELKDARKEARNYYGMIV